MKCPVQDEWVKFVDGELAVNRHEELEAHRSQCRQCAAVVGEVQRVVARMKPEADEWAGVDLLAGVNARIDAGDQVARSGSWLRWLVPGVAGALAVALVAVMFGGVLGDQGTPPGSEPRGAFTARGADDGGADKWVKLWLYQQSSKGNQPVSGKIASDAALLFGYRNTNQAFRYLMIFAIDATGQVRWYYPAYQDAQTDPASIAISAGKKELLDAISHPLPAGPIVFYGVFSNVPLHVHQVEAQISAMWKALGTRNKRTPQQIGPIALPGGQKIVQIRHHLQVVAPTGG